MTLDDTILSILKNQNQMFLSDFTDGRIKGLKEAKRLIGSCDKCKYSFQSGSNLKCRWMQFPLDPEGYCNFYEKRISNDDN